ncbi:SRC2-like protein [Tanacetum coccineum]
MECSRNLELRLVSAEGLKNRSWTSKSNVYAVVSISGSRNKKLKTPVDKRLQNRLTLLVKIKSAGMLSDKNLGEVRNLEAAVVRGVMIVAVGSWETLYLMLILVIIMAVDVVAVLVVVAIVVAAVVVATDEVVN